MNQKLPNVYDRLAFAVSSRSTQLEKSSYLFSSSATKKAMNWTKRSDAWSTHPYRNGLLQLGCTPA